jgi:hypothetical protein
METNSLPQLLAKMRSFRWPWSQNEDGAFAAHLGWSVEKRTDHRTDFRATGFAAVSAYFEAGACFAVEADIEVAASTGDLAPDQFDDLADSFYAKFNDMVGRVTETLGEPSFCDGAAADGFPDDQDAVWLALWVGDGLRIMVQQKNEGRDMPFRVTLVCAP